MQDSDQRVESDLEDSATSASAPAEATSAVAEKVEIERPQKMRKMSDRFELEAQVKQLETERSITSTKRLQAPQAGDHGRNMDISATMLAMAPTVRATAASSAFNYSGLFLPMSSGMNPTASADLRANYHPQQLWTGTFAAAAAANPLLSQALGLNIPQGSLRSLGTGGGSAANPGIFGGQSTTSSVGTSASTSQNTLNTAQSLQVSQLEAIDPNITGRPPVLLYMSCDDDSLSEYQCLVRKQIELFEARTEDVESNAQGRNRPIVMGQVGIRCRHCVLLPPKHRARGAIYYPAKLQGLYQAAQNMASGHLCEHCQHVPVAIRSELLKLRERKSSAGGGKKYWADGVRVLGVYEDEAGLRFQRR